MGTLTVAEWGTDVGPECWRCQGTIWHYKRHEKYARYFIGTCSGCHAVEGPIELPATGHKEGYAAFLLNSNPNKPGSAWDIQEIKAAHVAYHWKV